MEMNMNMKLEKEIRKIKFLRMIDEDEYEKKLEKIFQDYDFKIKKRIESDSFEIFVENKEIIVLYMKEGKKITTIAVEIF